ncbi:MAG: tol-pal system-associated acyl-CoA thioesterase [Chitinispirillaceae bacterium]
MKKNELQIRIYYEDTDCGNVVYYANYLRFMERGRTELLRSLGIDFSTYHEKGLMFAVVEANVKYKRPAQYDDLISVRTRVEKISTASITFRTDIFRDGTLLVSGDVKVACVKMSSGLPRRVPVEIVSALMT